MPCGAQVPAPGNLGAADGPGHGRQAGQHIGLELAVRDRFHLQHRLFRHHAHGFNGVPCTGASQARDLLFKEASICSTAAVSWVHTLAAARHSALPSLADASAMDAADMTVTTNRGPRLSWRRRHAAPKPQTLYLCEGGKPQPSTYCTLVSVASSPAWPRLARTLARGNAPHASQPSSTPETSVRSLVSWLRASACAWGQLCCAFEPARECTLLEELVLRLMQSIVGKSACMPLPQVLSPHNVRHREDSQLYA